MTVCIAVCLEDGAFLMADGREVSQFQNRIISDNVNKLTQVAQRVVCAQFGMSLPVQDAIRHLNVTRLDSATDANDVLNEFSRACFLGLAPFLPRLNVTREQLNQLRFGFLFGGLLSNDQPFFGGFLWIPNGTPSQFVEIYPGRFTALGGDDEVTKRLFRERLSDLTCVGEYPTVQSCIEAGEYTIRRVQESYPNVGGKIRYAIIRRGLSISFGEVD